MTARLPFSITLMIGREKAKMKICTLPLGPLNANCYVLIDETSGCAAIIDPGAFNERLVLALESNEVKKV